MVSTVILITIAMILCISNHLDANKQTIDDELEIANFAAAGKILGDIWSEGDVDGYCVDAKYVEPMAIDDKKAKYTREYDETWADTHITHGQYHISIMKCQDPNCCTNIRSNIHDIIPAGGYPAPKYYIQDKGIISLGKKHTDPPKNSHYSSYQMICTLSKGLPHNDIHDCHDDFNPLFTIETINSTKCRVCLKWFPSKKAMLNHRRTIHFRSRDNNNNPNEQKENDLIDYDALLTEAEIAFYNRIDRICDERNGKYLAVMSDGTKRWVILDNQDEKVTAYLSEKDALSADAYKIPDISDENYEKKAEEDDV